MWSGTIAVSDSTTLIATALFFGRLMCAWAHIEPTGLVCLSRMFESSPVIAESAVVCVCLGVWHRARSCSPGACRQSYLVVRIANILSGRFPLERNPLDPAQPLRISAFPKCASVSWADGCCGHASWLCVLRLCASFGSWTGHGEPAHRAIRCAHVNERAADDGRGVVRLCLPDHVRACAQRCGVSGLVLSALQLMCSPSSVTAAWQRCWLCTKIALCALGGRR